jgi:hypothetical protein
VHFKNGLFQKIDTKYLVRESEAAHTRLDAKDVVVNSEHVEGLGSIRRDARLTLDGDLRVVDAREVAGTSGLVLLGLEREGVRVHTGVGGAGVVVEGLNLVEVLTLLLLEAVLTVENQLEGVEGTNDILSEGDVGSHGASLEHGGTREGGGDEAVGTRNGGEVGLHENVRGVGGEVPQGIATQTPHQLLNGVVVGEADVLGAVTSNGVNAGVLHLLDQVLMTLLSEAATLLGVKVDVVGVHLEGIEVGGEIRREVNVNADLVVLESNEGQVETGVAVEEEEQGEVHGLTVGTSGHLTIVGLLGLIEVKLGVQTPPLLVVLVDTLATDGQLNVVDGALGDPARSPGGRGVRHELEVHVTDEVTVTGDGDGHATGVGGSTVDGLLDVLHREVGVALVFRLVEGYFGVASQVDILGTVSYELHETTGHCESFVLYTEKIILVKRAFPDPHFSEFNVNDDPP